MQREELKYVLELMEFFEKNPFPSSDYFKTVIVVKDLETDTAYGSISKDTFGNNSYTAS